MAWYCLLRHELARFALGLRLLYNLITTLTGTPREGQQLGKGSLI